MDHSPVSQAPRGLSASAAANRLAADGPNTLPDDGQSSTLAIIGEVVREPMFLLLMSCGLLYLVLGDPVEAAMLLGFVVVVIVITVLQERRTERALNALRDRSSPQALVVRDGHRIKIASADLVRGDLVVVSEGDRVPADGTMVEGHGISVDESLLTGEAAAVRKRARIPEDPPLGPPGGDDTPWLFSGTLVVGGQGLVEVAATGTHTAIGRIGTALASVQTGRSPLQEETRRIVRIIAIGGSVLCSGLVVFYGLTRGAWLEGLLTGLATAMALLPEEFPVVLTVFLALGAWRISQRHVLTRRMPAIETLGATTVLCTDKTGTLTQNQMVVRALWTPNAELTLSDPVSELPETFHKVVEHAILSSQVDPHDPMEQAFHNLALDTLRDSEHLHPDWSVGREYPLSSSMLAMTRAWTDASGAPVSTVSAKGSPEAILDLCHVPADHAAQRMTEVQDLARRGLRVLGVASAHHAGELPEDQHGFPFRLEGFVGLEDPIRASVPAAVAQCQDAGIRVIMITGDYPETARSIAAQAGIVESEPLTGSELETLDDDALEERMSCVSIAARIVPEDKLRIVRALRSRGEVVAMTGDGVNDAPALQAAHIGIAMGGRGTDVAREAAALVLLDDDFSSIVHAVALGRRIFDNLQVAMVYIVSIHVPLAGLATVPILMGWPVAVMPVHIVFLQLVIDPACSLVFEAEAAAPNSMRRPPRSPTARMLNAKVLARALAQGTGLLIVCVAVYAWGLTQSPEPTLARSLAFTTLMMGNMAMILANRSRDLNAVQLLFRPNRAFWAVVLGALAVLAVVLYAPGLNQLLHFEALTATQAAVCIAAGLASLTWVELVKWLRRLF